MSVLRTSIDEAIPLAELPSACTTPGHSAAERVDLFWSGVRSAGTGQVAMSWTSRPSLDRYPSTGIAHPGSRTRWSQEAALAKVRDDPTRLQALGALHLWRTMTSEQVAAVIGSPLTSSPRSVDLALLFAAGTLAEFACSVGLELEASLVLHPSVIERFCASATAGSPPTRRTLRSNLRHLARHAVANAVPGPAPMPRGAAKAPYAPVELAG